MRDTALADASVGPGSSGTAHLLSRIHGAGRPLVCGILNVTPDFSDGGLFDSLERAVEHGCCLAVEAADLVDIGGESTRPGSRPPTLAEELDRVIPVVEGLVRRIGLGFGKALSHNVALLASLGRLRSLGGPIMVGLSRKSMLGQLTGRAVGDRLPGSLAAAVIAAQEVLPCCVCATWRRRETRSRF